MAKLIDICKVILMIAVCTLCIYISILAHKLTATVTKLDSVITDVDSTVKRVDLLTKQTSYLILQLGVTSDQVRKQSLKESKSLDVITSQIQSTLGHLDGLVVTSTKNEAELTQTANQTLQSLQPTIVQSQIALAGLTTSLDSLNIVISNPDIPATLKAAKGATEATQTTMTNVAETSSDVHEAVHHYLHPGWVNSTVTWVLRIANVFNPL